MKRTLRAMRFMAALTISASATVFGNTWSLTSADGWNANESSAVSPAMVVRGNHDDCDGGCGTGCGDGCDCLGTWRDNTEVMFGGESYAGLGDFPQGGFGNSFGLVSGFNTGFALGQSRVRGQFGATYGAYDFKGRGFGAEADSLEEQVYLTGGIYKRADLSVDERVTWGLVYDGLITDNWGADASEVELGQVRGIGGWAYNECNEFGMWGTLRASDDRATITGRGTPDVRAMNQANLYWKHNWAFGAETMAYVGGMDNADVGDWVAGLTGRSPLSHNAALYGGFTYVTPSVNTGVVGDTEDAWQVNFGIVIYTGGKAVSPNVGGNAGLPLLPVANNGSFLITD